MHKQLSWKCFISALLNNTTALSQPPALSSLALHASVFQPRIPCHLTRSWCISILCSRLRAVPELTASWSPLAFTSRELQHPERAPSSCVGCEFTAAWLGERASVRYSAHRVTRLCWSSISPALETQALIQVAGTVPSNPSEAVGEKRLQKRCRKVIHFCGDR